MMPRKKRRTIIILVILLVIIAIAATMIILYFTTDNFKSNQTLFVKYMGKNLENLESTYLKISTNEYKQLQEQSKYTTQTKVKINDTEDIGTTSENAQNSINQLKLEINGQADKGNQYNYQEVQLLNNEEKVAKIEYIQNQNTYGIKFSDLFKQYLLVNDENMKEVLEGVNIPDNVGMGNELKNIFEFSEEEKQKINTKYINLISSNIGKENFSKQKNQTIEINKRKVNVNAYTLTLTKEQMNDIYINMLNELKQDEMVLTKIDTIQTVLQKYHSEQITNVREQFIENIDNLIERITKNNIGQEESKIIVYENYHNTVRTVVQNPEYEISIDMLKLQTEQYIQISYQNITERKEEILTYKKEEEITTASYKKIEGQTTTEYSLISNQKVNGNTCDKNVVAKYEDNSNRVEANIQQKINIVNEFENAPIINEENAINLSELEQEELEAVKQQVTNSVSAKIDELTTTVINIEDLVEVLKTIGIVSNTQAIESRGITETEKNRFNSKFEILQGENLENNDILKLIEAIKENFVAMEVKSDRELELKLERFNNNEEMATMLTNFIEGNRGKKYNARVEYDEETGLVSGIVLTMLER